MPARKKTSRARRPAKAKRTPVARPMRGLTAPSQALVHQVCSITDPFCPAAWGAKLPDGATTKSLPFTSEALVGLTTNAQGVGAVMMMPNWGPDYATAATMSSGSVTLWALGTTSTYPAASRVRLVSCGYEVNNVCTPMTSSGLLYARTFSPQTYGNLAAVDCATMWADSKAEQPLARVKNFQGVMSRLGVDAQEFRDGVTSSTLATMTNYGYQVGTIAVVGGPATTTVAMVRIIYHWEYVPADSDPLYQYATQTPMPNPGVIQASNSVMRTVGNFLYDNASKVYHSEAGKALLGYAARGAGAALSTYLGGGPTPGYIAGGTAHAMIVD